MMGISPHQLQRAADVAFDHRMYRTIISLVKKKGVGFMGSRFALQ
jgi:hypothetical protein